MGSLGQLHLFIICDVPRTHGSEAQDEEKDEGQKGLAVIVVTKVEGDAIEKNEGPFRTAGRWRALRMTR